MYIRLILQFILMAVCYIALITPAQAETTGPSGVEGVWDAFGGARAGCTRMNDAVYDSNNNHVFIATDWAKCGDYEINAFAWSLDLESNLFEPIPGLFEKPSRFGPILGDVRSITVYQGQVVVGGVFDTVDGNTVNNIARWNGSEWLPLGVGGNIGVLPGEADDGFTLSVSVEELVVHNGQLYVGGRFGSAGGTAANSIAVWDGVDWTPLGSGPGDGAVVSILPMGDAVFAAGAAFFDASGKEIGDIAKWDGATWSPVAAGDGINPFDGGVYVLQQFEGRLIAAGNFETVEGTIANNIAAWDGVSWNPLTEKDPVTGEFASGVTWPDPFGNTGGGSVDSLQVYDGSLIVSGSFKRAGLSAASGIAQWSGASWSEVGGGLYSASIGLESQPPGYADRMIRIGDRLLLVGGFNRANDANGILTTGATIDDGLEADNRASRIVWWDGQNWDNQIGVGQGTGLGKSFFVRPVDSSTVTAITVTSDNIFALGCFEDSGSRRVHLMAKWDGMRWSSLGLAKQTVRESFRSTASSADCGRALLVEDNDIYLGFDEQLVLQGKEFNSVAHFDGTEWKALGLGIQGNFREYVGSIIRFQGDIYVAGKFDQAGEISANNIARWDGSQWSALGPSDLNGTNGTVRDMAVFENKLVVAGGFGQAGGNSMPSGLAVWDGVEWSRFAHDPVDPDDFGGHINALKRHGERLYAAGRRLSADDFTSLDNVIYWDGSRWNKLGLNSSTLRNDFDSIEEVEIFGDQVYARGNISISSDQTSEIVRWNGSEWQRVPEGLGLEKDDRVEQTSPLFEITEASASVNALALSRDGLVVGGSFLSAGGKRSKNIARFIPLSEVLLGLSLEQATDVQGQLGSRNVSESQAVTASGEIMVDLIVRNQGADGVMGADLALMWSPLPQEITWSCQSLSEGNAICPAQNGTGEAVPTLDLPAGGGMRFTFSLTPAADAVFQDIRALLNADDVIGVTGVTSDSLNISLPVSAEGVFKDEFE